MGQTLTHGIYLPEEGERNCYAGLAANWQLLDGAIGTVAEHTSQIAGKAPLVHTHTKSDITDFPAYGNTAGTICEGNDSRLSDARTPVAHTHGKADITDLFNSANTWTGEQTIYSYANIQSQVLERAVTPANTAHVSLNLRDKNNHDLGIFRSLTYNSSGNSIITVFGVTQIKDGQVDPTGTVNSYGFTETCKLDGTKYFTFDGYMGSNLEPLSVNQSIGSASNQWNNLYAKNYFYNGTAWGLDKANVWTQNQTISINLPVFTLQDTIGVRDTTPANARNLTFSFLDKNGDSYGFINRQHKPVTGTHLHQVSINNGTYDYRLQFYLFTNGASNFAPSNDGIIELGTSTNKWKTLNGINPGALSLPNVNAVTGSSNTELQDISGDLVQDQYFNCYFTPRMDGWAYIYLDCSNATIISGRSSYTVSVKTARGIANALYSQAFTKNENSWRSLQIFIPVTANKEITLECTFTGFSVAKGYVIPCLGNV